MPISPINGEVLRSKIVFPVEDSGEVTVQENGVTKGTVNIIDFVNGTNTTVSVGVVGDKATVQIDASGGGGSSNILYVGWNFAANGGAFPTALQEPVIYVAADDHGNFGDADFVAQGAWMIAKVVGANTFSQYSIKF